MHDRAEQFGEGAADNAVFPPYNLRLERVQAGQRQPANLAFMHPVDRGGGEAGDGQVVHHAWEGAATRCAQR